MKTPLVFVIGPHQYRIVPDTAGWFRVEYALFGTNGTTVKPRPGEPNAHAWRFSQLRFRTYAAASAHAEWLMREQDRPND